MATKKPQREAQFEGRLSVRLSMEQLTWAAKVGASVGQDSSWAIRWAVDHARAAGVLPIIRTVTADAARRGGAV